ncbi:NADPH-dependent FMN reductase [Fulvivirga imtechensis AK7]|uniref:NADPH-dependent FMN reductase n=1 Tax=Fulvivirga imtechensis AK7 TaxID=1237149 RepID=L8JSA4_9BACT|nr:NAD(P)H-dependent oxidoreductase [Fulvivirga imtechensis]ELR71841.1 NADPH-dependent FMN reductase [Fulvivirga imtechensis AK7]
MQKIVIVCGTNRSDSVSYQIALIYKEILNHMGVGNELIDLSDLPHDFAFSALYENSGRNDAFNPFREIMVNHKKFVFIVPEYNGSFPGVLKTFIDGLKYPDTFRDKKCALVGISSGIQGGGLALSHLTDIFHYCGMHVLAHKPKLSHIERHFQEGTIINELYMTLLQEQAEKLIEF